MFVHSLSSTSILYSTIEFVNQERLKVLVGGIALGILLFSAVYGLYSCFWHAREVKKSDDLEKEGKDLSPVFDKVRSDKAQEKQTMEPNQVLAAQNHLLTDRIRKEMRAALLPNDYLIAVQTHVHRIFDNVYLGNLRSFFSIDSRFIRKYSMVESKDDIVKSLQLNEALSYKEAEAIYENYKKAARKGCSKLNIKHVISVTQFKPAATVSKDDWSWFQPDLSGLGVDRLQIPVDDDAFTWDTIVPHLDTVFDKIDQARLNYEPILIHCAQGSSRSATVLIAYLINRCSVPYEQALSFVKDKRPQAEPKPYLAKALQDYQQMLEKQRGYTFSSIKKPE